MRIGLFCSGEVGLEVARLIHRREKPLVLLAYDSRGSASISGELHELRASASMFSSEDLMSRDVVEQIRHLDLDLIILAWWPYLLSPDLRNAPRLGCLNFHPSLLPHNRGKHPNFWALVEQRPFGVSLHWLAEKIDAGPIAFQRAVPVTWEDTGSSLHEKARSEIVELFQSNMDRIWAGDIPSQPQVLSDGSFHQGREIDSASQIELDRTYSAREILTLLRARTYPPHPAAWFEENGVRYEARIQITRVAT